MYKIKSDRFCLEFEPDVHESDLTFKANTNLRVKVVSDGFSADSFMDIDVKDLSCFAAQLHGLYESLEGAARLEEPYSVHNYIEFSAMGGGHIAVRGRINNKNAYGRTQELTFDNEIDQTYLQGFAKKLFADYCGNTAGDLL